MTAELRLPRLLAEIANTGPAHQVAGSTVAEALDDLFSHLPGLRNHVLGEGGAIRPHVSVFVDGRQADLDTAVGSGARIRILHAVSGGGPELSGSRLV
jgi:molybdopterin synthase sulfur carrier subunit